MQGGGEMNTHERWAQKMMSTDGHGNLATWGKAIEKRGADRERRRIRRLQRGEYHWIEQAMGNYHGGSCHCMRCEAGRALIRIDAATRAPKKGKR
jgi:hypothetical protein